MKLIELTDKEKNMIANAITVLKFTKKGSKKNPFTVRDLRKRARAMKQLHKFVRS